MIQARQSKMPTSSKGKDNGGSLTHLSYVYYLATEPGKKHVRQMVDMDVPLPSMTWFRHPIRKPKDARMESLQDSIELYLKELSDDSSSSHHIVDVGPSCSASILPPHAIVSDDEGDADVEATVVPLPRRRGRSTRHSLNRTTQPPKKLPPRSVTVPSRIFLESSSHNATTPTSSTSSNDTNGRPKRRPPKVSSRSSTTSRRYSKSTKIVQ
jgi:hypothetical protein